MTGLDSGLNVLVLNKLAEESANEGIASAIGINKEVLAEGLDGIFGDHTIACDDGGLVTLSEDDGAGTRGVLLGQGSNL